MIIDFVKLKLFHPRRDLYLSISIFIGAKTSRKCVHDKTYRKSIVLFENLFGNLLYRQLFPQTSATQNPKYR